MHGGPTTRRRPHFLSYMAMPFPTLATTCRSSFSEAVSLMRKSVANAVVPVGWPPLAEVLGKLVTKKIPIYACGACSRARGVTEADLADYGAKFGNPKIFVSLVEWADRIITE